MTSSDCVYVNAHRTDVLSARDLRKSAASPEDARPVGGDGLLRVAKDIGYFEQLVTAAKTVAEFDAEVNESSRRGTVVLEVGRTRLWADIDVTGKEPVVRENVKHTVEPFLDRLFIPADAAAEFWVDSRNPFARSDACELSRWPLMIVDVPTAEDSREFQARVVKGMSSPTPNATLLEHSGGRPLVKIEDEISVAGRFESRSGYSFTRGPRCITGVRPIHFRVIDWVAVFSHPKGVLVNDAAHENLPC